MTSCLVMEQAVLLKDSYWWEGISQYAQCAIFLSSSDMHTALIEEEDVISNVSP